MRTLSFVITLWNVRPLPSFLAIFTALVLVSVSTHSTITEGKNIQEAPGNTQASLIPGAALLLPQKPPLDFDGELYPRRAGLAGLCRAGHLAGKRGAPVEPAGTRHLRAQRRGSPWPFPDRPRVRYRAVFALLRQSFAAVRRNFLVPCVTTLPSMLTGLSTQT